LRIRWYHAPLLYGLGVLLGVLLYGLWALVWFRSSVILNTFLYYVVFLGAYSLPYTRIIWLALIPITGVLGGMGRRYALLAVLICIGAGLAVSLFGLLVVLPDVYRAIGAM